MKVSYIFAIVMLISALMAPERSSAQKRGGRQYDEAGIFLGAGYYNGEINPVKPMYKPNLAVGLNLRHVLNDRMGITFQTIWCKLKGDDKDFDNPYQQARAAKFENEVVELSLQMEVNFLPLIPGDPVHFATPYIAAGPGMTVAAFPNEGLRFCIPMGVGVKISPNDRVTLSAEWKYRKLFSDELDNIRPDLYDMQFGSKAAKQKSFLGDDDWYSFIGVVLGFRLGGGGRGACQAYRD